MLKCEEFCSADLTQQADRIIILVMKEKAKVLSDLEIVHLWSDTVDGLHESTENYFGGRFVSKTQS